MSKTGKIILGVFISILVITLGIVLYIYYPAIEATINNERYYTAEDVDNAYNAGAGDKEEMQSQIDSLKIEVDKYLKDIADYQSQLDSTTKNLQDALTQNEVDAETIESLNVELQNTKDNLSAVEGELAEALNEIVNLTAQLENKDEQISNLTTTLEETQAELQSTIEELETTTTQLNNALTQNELDDETISSLTSQVDSLTSQNENLSSQVVSLNNQVLELQAELAVYEEMDLENYYKVTFINDSNDAIVSTTYISKNTVLNNPPVVENTYNYWFYGWASTEESEAVVDFNNFTVDNNYTFYSILSNNIDLMITGDENLFEYVENEAGEGTSAHTRQAVYRYGENLTVGDILQINDKVILQGLEDGDITYQFNEGVTLNTKLKDLPNQTAAMPMHGEGTYSWTYKELSCKLILDYTDPYISNVNVEKTEEENGVVYEMIGVERDLDITTVKDVALQVTYLEETVNTTITSLLSSQYEAVGDYIYRDAFYGVKVTPFEDKNIEVHFLMSINGDGQFLLKFIDPNAQDNVDDAEIKFSLKVEYENKYISHLAGVENHEFWYLSNASFEAYEN